VPLYYDRQRIAEICRRVAAGEWGHYGQVDAWLYSALQRYPIAGQRVAVMGSTDQGYGPWYEAICLHYGARPVTVDYNPIEFEDERLQFMRAPLDWARVEPLDAALSISSFEHDGLGRYGEPLDPAGDLKAMQLMKRLLKPGGRLFLTVPVGKDKVVFNIHRIYGRLRLPLLLQGWTVEDRFGWEESALDRDTGFGWEPVKYLRGPAGWEVQPLHPGCPEYAPVWVLRNEPA
jgi:SAM-dependent methyltransferase